MDKNYPSSHLESLLADFKVFLWVVWRHLRLPEPTPLQRDIADYLQSAERRIIVEAFRGVGKSWMTSAFVCWSLLRDPQLNILVVSASKQRADDFSTFTRRLIHEIPLLAVLKPKPHQRDANIAFDVGPALASHAPSVKSMGITGQLTGTRADLIIADDVEAANNVQTHFMREKLKATVGEFEAILKPGGRIIYLGTPQTESSLYHTLATQGYRPQIWPARVPDADMVPSYHGSLAPRILTLAEPGCPTEPTRFGTQELLERELSYGRSGFALQFMLDTTLSDERRYPLKLCDLIVMDCNKEVGPVRVVASRSIEWALPIDSVGIGADRFYQPCYISKDWAPYEGSVMTIDPAGRGTDETAYCVVKHLKGQLFATQWGGLAGGYEDNVLAHLARVARDEKVNRILVESNFGDGMFKKLLEPIISKIYPVTLEEVRHHTQKEKRIIDTLEPVLNQHRLVVDRAQIETERTAELPYQLMYQLTRITKDRGSLAHDDRLEALAMAVSYWTQSLSQDVQKAEALWREKWLDDQLRIFMDNALGYPQKEWTWI